MDFLTFDIETTYGEENGRVGNRWSPNFGLCSIGYKYGQGGYYDDYTVNHDVDPRVGLRPGFGDVLPFPKLEGVSILVGHNIKFDLLWYWDHPELKRFFKRGGVVWDTQYAEYLLSGQFYGGHVKGELKLSACAKRRGLSYQKLDVVKALWDKGVRTEDIDPDVLLEYQRYDVLTTEELFVTQVKQAREQGQVHMIQQRMEGLLATTEMEFNGMMVDQKVAQEQMDALEVSIKEKEKALEQYIPELPDGCSFNWASWRNVSALLFGGDIKYTGVEYSLNDGNLQYYKKKITVVCLDEDGQPIIYKSGKRKGEIKTKQETVDDYDRGPKTRQCNMYFTLPGIAEPRDKWKSSVEGYWSTEESVLEELAEKQNVSLVKDLLSLKGMLKDLGTYYKRFTKGNWTGMLTNIQPDGCVHGQLNHTVTVTSRLSSSKPNLQNIPKEGKSEVKRVFISRFTEGKIVGIDYSQLEVVCKGVLSGDKALLQALIDKVCFHCEWCSFVHGVDYDFVYHKVKVEHDPVWIRKRSDVKPITFGEAYGKGISGLAEDSGVPADAVEAAIAARKAKYPDMYKYDQDVADEVQRNRKITTLRTDEGYQRAVGYYRSPTGTIYSFLEQDAPGWKKDQGIHTAFSPTQMKNYPSQGLGGEIMEVQAGRVWRKLIQLDLTDVVLMINTVHDALYLDCKSEDAVKEYLPGICSILEDVCPYFNKIYPDVNWDTPFPVDAEYGDNMLETTEHITERNETWIS